MINWRDREGEIKKGTIAYVDLWKEYFSEKLIFFTPAIAGLKIILTFAPQSREIAIKKRGSVVQLVRIHACHAWGRGFESRPDRFQRKQNKVKLCNLKITGLFLFPHLSRMTAHLQNSMFVKHSQKQGAAICFAVGFNDVVSENAITLTFCLKIRDYDDRAFLRIEEIGSALWSNYPFYPVFLYEYLY